jgi:hypothetical protein
MPKTPWRNNTRSVLQADLTNKALGVGDPNSADKAVGKQNARYARVDLTGGGTGREFDVPHDLGQTPTSVSLDGIENATTAGTTIIVNAVRQENWSHTHVHAFVQLVSGSLDGCVARFVVKGR